MRYLSLTEQDRSDMLRTLGLTDSSQLFESIPESIRLQRPLDLPDAQSESDIIAYFKKLAGQNASLDTYSYFLGAGAYQHFIPAVIDFLISRGEFFTAYTPYQPEVSQGTLQAIFEFQTMICQLAGLEVANASLYDGSTAMVEAVLMAERVTRRKKVLLAGCIHPEYRAVLDTYLKHLGMTVEVVPETDSGAADPEQIRSRMSDQTAVVVTQNPNFLGIIEPLQAIGEVAHQAGALYAVVVTEAISLGLLRAPGELGADIVCGEGQSLGVPVNFGGPYLGFMATRDQFKRNMPGRIVGQTADSKGRRGFVLTLATREQHIRREKATSNICTNTGLCALMATIFMTLVGKQGLREMALQSYHKAHYLQAQLAGLGGFNNPYSGKFFNEFVVDVPGDAAELQRALLAQGIVAGLPLSRYFPKRKHSLLLCATERNCRQEVDRLVELLKQ